jgi:hypothetical protein
VPKTKIDPRPSDDVPVWDALVAELGDPRPYAPTVAEFTTVTVTDEPCVDVAAFDGARSELDDHVDDARGVVDGLTDEAYDALTAIVDEFRERHNIPTLPPPTDPVLDELRDRTVVLPVLYGERTLRMARDEEELKWPS